MLRKIGIGSLTFMVSLLAMEPQLPNLNDPLTLLECDLSDQVLAAFEQKVIRLAHCTEYNPVEDAFVRMTALLNNPGISAHGASMFRLKSLRANLFEKMADAYVTREAAIHAQHGLADDFYEPSLIKNDSFVLTRLPVEIEKNESHFILKLLRESHVGLKKELIDSQARLHSQLQKEREQLEAELKKLEEERDAWHADNNRKIARLERDNTQLKNTAENYRWWRNFALGGVAASAVVSFYVIHKRANAQTDSVALPLHPEKEDESLKDSTTSLIANNEIEQKKNSGLLESLRNTVRYIVDSLTGFSPDMKLLQKHIQEFERFKKSQQAANQIEKERLEALEKRSFPVNLGSANRYNADVLGIKNSDGTVNIILDAVILRTPMPQKTIQKNS